NINPKKTFEKLTDCFLLIFVAPNIDNLLQYTFLFTKFNHQKTTKPQQQPSHPVYSSPYLSFTLYFQPCYKFFLSFY
ncbi:hypothetical protein, partial [Neisseria dentiae]|uniref:hypothetical protein n=1 Tax=Neisseria dentiae TaxID=194197 RepID=UPI0035A00E51